MRESPSGESGRDACSRWGHAVFKCLCAYALKVLQAAFQARGPFISTFANPSRAGPYIRGDGTLRPRAPDLDSGFTPASPSRGSGGSASSAGKM